MELKVILKQIVGGFAPKRRTLRKHKFLLSQTHIWHLLDSTISSKSPLQNAARNAFEKRLTKERDKTLAGSTLGGKGPKMCPKRLPIELPSRFILFYFFFKLLAMRGFWGPRLTPERHKNIKMHQNGAPKEPKR